MQDISLLLKADQPATNVLPGHFAPFKVCRKPSHVHLVTIARADPLFQLLVLLELIMLKRPNQVRPTVNNVQSEITVRHEGCTNQFYVRTDISATHLE